MRNIGLWQIGTTPYVICQSAAELTCEYFSFKGLQFPPKGAPENVPYVINNWQVYGDYFGEMMTDDTNGADISLGGWNSIVGYAEIRIFRDKHLVIGKLFANEGQEAATEYYWRVLILTLEKHGVYIENIGLLNQQVPPQPKSLTESEAFIPEEYIFNGEPEMFLSQVKAYTDRHSSAILVPRNTDKFYVKIDIRSQDWIPSILLGDRRIGSWVTVTVTVRPGGKQSKLTIGELTGEWAKVKPEVTKFFQYLKQQEWIDSESHSLSSDNIVGKRSSLRDIMIAARDEYKENTSPLDSLIRLDSERRMSDEILDRNAKQALIDLAQHLRNQPVELPSVQQAQGEPSIAQGIEAPMLSPAEQDWLVIIWQSEYEYHHNAKTFVRFCIEYGLLKGTYDSYKAKFNKEPSLNLKKWATENRPVDADQRFQDALKRRKPKMT